MPDLKSPRRISNTTLRAAPSKRRSVKRPKAKRAASTSADVLLVAQFAEALGQSPRKPQRKSARGGRRSLSEALQGATPNHATDIVGLMPGVRLHETSKASAPADAASYTAPCFAGVQRRRRNARLAGAASWCLAFAVTAGIVSAAAYGFVSHAPVPQPITTASAAQF